MYFLILNSVIDMNFLIQVISDEDVRDSKEIAKFGESITALINEGEDDKTLLNYKDAVLNVLNLKSS